jgi:hypothetical protein
MLIALQFKYYDSIRVYRTLPLTGLGCALLIMSFPAVMCISVTPCVGVVLWLAGSKLLHEFWFAWIFGSIVSIPFFTALLSRRGLTGVLVAAALIVAGVVVLAPIIHQRDLLTPESVWWLAALSMLISAGSVWSLCHDIKSSSKVYRQRVSQRESSQW